jgi:tRNA(Met) cytidine acetyltransferase
VNDERQTRSCQVLAGDRERALALLRAALAAGSSRSCLWFGEAAPDGVRRLGRHDYLDALGSECDLLVYDAHAGLYPDVLAALLGTLRGGGVLVLLSPSWAQWAAFGDPALAGLAPWPLGSADVGRRFLQRLQDHFAASPGVRILDVDRIDSLVMPPVPPAAQVPGLNKDQQRVVEALLRVATGHARRPLVLTADRGRGKSTALGAGLARLLRERSCRVAVLAPTRRAVDALFARLQRDLPHAGGEVRYWRPADFLVDAPDCDLLVIDEAAALGVPLLQTLAERYNRVVFSTTVQGYEGSGRGFVQRFLAWLNERFRNCRHLELTTPVRWAPGDPLEALASRLFLLDVEASPPVQGAPRYRWLDRDVLAQDEALLRQVFGLLVSAHYRTRPSDLRQLLDAPEVSVLVAERAGQVIGVLLAAAEGGLDAALAEAVCAGRRRPRGHPLLQSLATHGGWCRAPTLRLLRIMRIAVDERHRRVGVGSRLLARARERAEVEGFDLLGTRYGLSPGLLRFWQHNGYRVVRIGHRVDPASAAHSVQMLASLSAAGAALCDAAGSRFLDDLPWRLASGLARLDPAVVPLLLRGQAGVAGPVDAQTLSDVRHFAFGRRDFEDALPSLRRWLCARLAGQEADVHDAVLLVRPVLQGQRPARDQIAALRQVVGQWLGGD